MGPTRQAAAGTGRIARAHDNRGEEGGVPLTLRILWQEEGDSS